MKKMLLLSKICLMALCLIFCSLSVYAVTDNVPKTINLQGRYTRNYGDPIANTQMRVYFQVKKGSNWESVQGSPFSTTTDSEGLYNLNVTVSNFSSDMTHFRVGIDNEPTGDGYAFSSSPYAIYSSTSAYALSLDPANGDKLVDGNFKSDTTYNITVANAVLATTANNALKVSTETASSKKGFVWGITDNSGTQAWVDPGEIQIHEATTSILGGILLGNSDTGLVMKGDNKTLKINNGAGLLINNNELVLDTNISNLQNYTKTSDLSTVATSGKYSDLTEKLIAGTNITISGLTISATNTTYTGSDGITLTGTNFTNSGVRSVSTGNTNGTISVNTNGTTADVAVKGLGSAAYTASTAYATAAQGAKAESALQSSSIKTGSTDGTISVASTDVAVKGLGSAAYTASTAYATAEQGTKADNALQTSNITTGNTNGTIKVKNEEVAVKGLGSAAYTDSSAYATAEQGSKADSAIQSLTAGDGISVSGTTISAKVASGSQLGSVKVGSGLSVASDGTISVGGSGADLAEIYQSSEKLVPGDVVSIDTTKDNAIVKTKVAEDTLVAGVISTEPGVLMNQKEKGYKLALVGKVPTKVCNEGGAVKRGDLLVSASIPGYAKKAGDNPKAGTVIGKALENLDSQKGTILVLVNLQ